MRSQYSIAEYIIYLMSQKAFGRVAFSRAPACDLRGPGRRNTQPFLTLSETCAYYVAYLWGHFHCTESTIKRFPYADMHWLALDLYRPIGAIWKEHLSSRFGLYDVPKCRTRTWVLCSRLYMEGSVDSLHFCII